ncbi:hypothetical protein C6P40_002131 [Pichia californica]|uniref:nitrilase n=1 Tax=Pichia californica TaxID=460514 RepID=A0A9P7BFJ5_9ASCO|nr:hypothetical protein C6P42_001386 [[Candida] californica]KAG0690632.1 hypothetical protein C6P40_002131 [[Candida] californica]
MGAIIKVATVNAEPVWFDLQGTVKRTNELIKEAYEKGAELIGFPEVFVPGYPPWIWTNAADFDRNVQYHKNSLSYDSPEFKSIIETIKKYPIHVVLGFSERDNGSLYISQCIIDNTGEVVLKRRKFKPTHVERVIWGDATVRDLNTVVTLNFREAGPVEVGCLSCWEHMQPLLTYNSATQHEKIHIGSWPIVNDLDGIACLTKDGFYCIARTYASQTQSFYLFSSQLGTSFLTESLPDVEITKYFEQGASCSTVFAPDGTQLVPNAPSDYDGVIICDLDMDKIIEQKNLVDIVGHYSRPDMFSLSHNDANVDHVHK